MSRRRFQGQSQGKLRYLAAKTLLYTNHHQLEAKLKASVEASIEDKSTNRLSLEAFRELAGNMLIRYNMGDLHVCDNCGTVAEEDSLPDAQDLSMRLDEGGVYTYTSKECHNCGTLSYPMRKMIAGSVIDKLYHDRTLNVSFAHADSFAKELFYKYSTVDLDGEDALEYSLAQMAKARLYYLDLLSQVCNANTNRRNGFSMIIKDVNTFILFANDSKEKGCLFREMPEEGAHDASLGDAETLDTLESMILSDMASDREDDVIIYIADAKRVFFAEYC